MELRLENSKLQFYTNLLDIKICEENLNPLNLQGGVNDCTIRSLSKVLNKPYKEIYHELARLGEEQCRMYNSTNLIKEFLKDYNYKSSTFDYRISVGQFMYQNKKGKFIISTKNHMCAYIDGVWYDNEYCLKNPDLFVLDTIKIVFYEQNLEVNTANQGSIWIPI